MKKPITVSAKKGPSQSWQALTTAIPTTPKRHPSVHKTRPFTTRHGRRHPPTHQLKLPPHRLLLGLAHPRLMARRHRLLPCHAPSLHMLLHKRRRRLGPIPKAFVHRRRQITK